MSIDVVGLKTLRELTGAGVMDCRKALEQSGGDQEAAAALLREWGMDEVEKRAERATREGRAAAVAGPAGIGLAVLACETDFVARNELFVETAQAMARAALERRLSAPDGALAEAAAELGRRMKENIAAGQVGFLSAEEGQVLDLYVHGEGRIAAAVRVRADDPSRLDLAELRGGVHDLCLQIAAKAPRYLSRASVPPADAAAAEAGFRDEIEADPRLAGKGAALLAQVLTGKLRRHWAETCLLGQRFVKDETIEVGEFMDRLGKAAGTRIEPTGFLRLAVGEDEGEKP